MDGRQPLVASDLTALAIALQVVQKLADDFRRQLFHGHAIDGAAYLLAGKRQQQCQRVAVAGLGVEGKIALGDQMFQQEPPDPRTKQALILHCRPPSRTEQSARWPPGGDPASSANSAGLNGYRCGQGRLRVAEAVAAPPGRSDTMRSPGAPRLCGEYRAAVEVEARRQGN